MNLTEILQAGKPVLEKLRRGEVGEITDGFTNLIKENLGLLSEEAQTIYAYRYEQCLTCPVRVDNVCSKHQYADRKDQPCRVHGCACNLQAKVRSPRSWCPRHLWAPVHPDTLEVMPFPVDPKENLCRPTN